jgi:hypothetical protein
MIIIGGGWWSRGMLDAGACVISFAIVTFLIID